MNQVDETALPTPENWHSAWQTQWSADRSQGAVTLAGQRERLDRPWPSPFVVTCSANLPLCPAQECAGDIALGDPDVIVAAVVRLGGFSKGFGKDKGLGCRAY
ncbi:hypothetical protein PoB_002923700 [Plakobranchus ocellatus]|uniref:Uncharacterized protein n=1 Tax=Plakobranchus ocellatus TaxID=259542 RepID=A0AAV4A745_9GAST|nr:hypothetical protein PoB_002923700 [Plakobranchus ocellatus]